VKKEIPEHTKEKRHETLQKLQTRPHIKGKPPAFSLMTVAITVVIVLVIVRIVDVVVECH
jgi:hypothetical protein